jgi:hypothetical protein
MRKIMQNSLFDDLKDLKKEIAQSEKEENEKKEHDLRETKEKKLKTDFEKFMKDSGIKKLS